MAAFTPDALCRTEYGGGTMLKFFYADENNPKEQAKAISICLACPVQDECLDYALKYREEWGIWGGQTEKDRIRILRRRQRDRRKARRSGGHEQ